MLDPQCGVWYTEHMTHTTTTHLQRRYGPEAAICESSLPDLVFTSEKENTTCVGCLEKLLASARNYAYECAMSDYSYASIKSSSEQVKTLETLIRNLGATPSIW